MALEQKLWYGVSFLALFLLCRGVCSDVRYHKGVYRVILGLFQLTVSTWHHRLRIGKRSGLVLVSCTRPPRPAGFLHFLSPMLRPQVLPMFPQHHPVGHAFFGHLHHVSHWARCLTPDLHVTPAIQADELGAGPGCCSKFAMAGMHLALKRDLAEAAASRKLH